MNRFVLMLIMSMLFLNGCATIMQGGDAEVALKNGTQKEYIKKYGGQKSLDTESAFLLQYLCRMYLTTDNYQMWNACYNTIVQRFKNSSDPREMIAIVKAYSALAQLQGLVFHDNEKALGLIQAGLAFLNQHENEFPKGAIINFDQYVKELRLVFYELELVIYHTQGKEKEKRAAYKKILPFVPMVKSLDPLWSGEIYIDMAQAFTFAEYFDDAADLYRHQHARETYNDDEKKHDLGSYFLGRADLAAKRFSSASRHFKSLETYGVFENHPILQWLSYQHHAQALIGLGLKKEAVVLLKKSISIIESARASLKKEKNKIGFVKNKQEVYGLLVQTLMNQKRYDEAFAYAERGKARALVDMLASKKKFDGGNVMSSSEQGQLLVQLDAAEAKARVIGGSEADRSATRSVVIKNRVALIQQAPELSSLVTVAAPDVKEIQNLLPAGETLIEYYGSGDNLFAFVVSKSGIQGVKLNGAGLKESVTSFRQAILDPKSNAYKREGLKLYKQLIAPVVSGIKSKNITIVPHGALHYVPFSALYTGRGFMLNKYHIRILPSASVMKFLKKNDNKAGSLLAFGNPDLGDAKYDLPGAQKEAEMITSRTAGAKLLVRGQATETAVKSYGNSFKYLHFASHGIFDAEKPLNSGLLLAKDDQNDGMLTVGELYDLNLNADLVTLSACETALGRIANGDDVVGFTRGFLYAGASSIVSSLWQVDDAATSVLMQRFYENLKKTDKRSALRNAQLSTKSKYPHPYYWAAFQMTGAVK